MNVSRRRVLKGVAAAGVLPLFNIGCAGFGQGRAVRIAKGDKLRVALIGCGIQGRTIINAVLLEKLVAIVDPDPSQLERMDKEVAALNDAACSANYAGVRKFATYQDMFNAVGDGLDAVIIETPNHQHILPALLAIRRGIHVFLDKPLVLTVAEGDLLLAETRKRHGIVTQVGTYGHTFPSMTYCVDRIREGALGEVTEVWAYDDRCNSVYTRPGAVPPPKGMDWDAWCGGSPICDFYPESSDQDGMHPHGWHSWIGYGNGSIGNLGMHIMDVAFYALGLKDPDRVTCHDAQFACEGAWAYRDVFEFHFPATERHGEVRLHWWDGLKDGVPYKKEFVNKFGLPHKREWLNIPRVSLKRRRSGGSRKTRSTKTAFSSLARKRTSGSRTTAASVLCRDRPAGACRGWTGRTTSTIAATPCLTSVSSTRRSANGERRTTTSNTVCRSRKQSASATFPRSPERGPCWHGTARTSPTTPRRTLG